MKYFGIISLLILVASCNKKDRYNDEAEFLVGTWKWNYSIHGYDYCNNSPSELDTILNNIDPKNFKIKFIKRGIFKYYEDDVEVASHCTKFGLAAWGDDENGTGAILQLISQTAEEDTIFVFSFDGTYLRHDDYPFKGDSTCDIYYNYFVRE